MQVFFRSCSSSVFHTSPTERSTLTDPCQHHLGFSHVSRSLLQLSFKPRLRAPTNVKENSLPPLFQQQIWGHFTS